MAILRSSSEMAVVLIFFVLRSLANLGNICVTMKLHYTSLISLADVFSILKLSTLELLAITQLPSTPGARLLG